jgi:hypothetical protein
MNQVIFSSKPADFDKWLTMDPAHLRILFYNNTITKDYIERSIYQDDEKICFAENSVKIKLSSTGKIYTKRKSTAGFTYTRATKKGKSWFGKYFNIREYLKGMKDCLGIDTEWLSDLHYEYTMTSSNTVISKIISGKISNCRDMIKEYLKYHQRGSNISPEQLYKYLKSKTYLNTPLKVLLSSSKYYTDPNYFNDAPVNFDLLQQAKMLDRKINPHWSAKKQAEVHKDWTREIMEIELQYLEDEVVDYTPMPKLPGFRLINTRKELFQVGKIENHCVYTNYWSQVRDKTQFILYGKYEDTMYTCSIYFSRAWCGDGSIDKAVYAIGQLYKAHNNGAPQELRDIIQLWLDKPEVQEFFKFNEQNKSAVVSSSLELVDLLF